MTGWLLAAALLIFGVLMVGGATRLTQSGLSITEWKPVAGVVPPRDDRAWQIEFDNYKKIPQFRQINPRMTMSEFKGIYWWEWTHRILARLLGAVYVIGFIALLFLQQIPQRLIWRGGVLVGLVVLQGVIGWLMVKTGLTRLPFVAAEMLTTHLFMALLLLLGSVWTALESDEGQGRGRGAPGNWKLAAGVLVGIGFIQCLLGALVAGNRAGLVYNDFPLMNGQVLPPVAWEKGIGYSFLHDQGLVQFMHRLNAFLLLTYVAAFAIWLSRRCQDDGIKGLAVFLGGLVAVQIGLGVATLVTVVNIWFALAHQFTGVALLVVATVLMWRICRSDYGFRRSSFG